MPDTFWGYLPIIPLVLALPFVWKKSRKNHILYLMMVIYYPVYLIGQDLLGTYNPAILSAGMSMAIVYFSNRLAESGELLTLSVSIILLLSSVTDIVFIAILQPLGDMRFIWPYQHFGGMCFWAVCYCLAKFESGETWSDYQTRGTP